MPHQLNKDTIAIPIQDEWIEDGYYIQDANENVPCLSFMGNAPVVLLPPGPWQILGLSDQISEEMAQTVIKRFYDIDGIPGWDDTMGGIWKHASSALSALLSSLEIKNALILTRK